MTAPVRMAVAGGGYGAKVALPVYRELDVLDVVGATLASLSRSATCRTCSASAGCSAPTARTAAEPVQTRLDPDGFLDMAERVGAIQGGPDDHEV